MPALKDEHPEMSDEDIQVFKRKWICMCRVKSYVVATVAESCPTPRSFLVLDAQTICESTEGLSR